MDDGADGHRTDDDDGAGDGADDGTDGQRTDDDDRADDVTDGQSTATTTGRATTTERT